MSEWMGESNHGVAILRVSSYRQKDNISHETQEKEIREYCARHGIRLTNVHHLIESAKDFETRKKYSAAIGDALTKKIRHILFYMYDREARNLTDNERNEKYVRADLIVLHYVRDNKVLHKSSSDSEFFIRDVQAAASKQFSRTLSTKVVDALKQKAECGWYPGNRPPLGYMNKKVKGADGSPVFNGPIIVPDENEHAVRLVRREFELRAQGYSCDEIRTKALAEGLVRAAGISSYFRSTIEQRLKNPFYAGMFQWDGKLYRGKHELIISPKIIEAVRNTQGGKKTLRIVDEHGVFAGGWLRCAECGCQITYGVVKKFYRRDQRTVVHHYYRCANGKRMHKSLAGRYVSEDKIWEQFEALLDRIHISPTVARAISDALNESDRKSAIEGRRAVEALKEKLEDLNKREDAAYDMMFSRKADQETIHRQLQRLRGERVSLNQRIEEAKSQMSGVFRESVESTLELAMTAKELWKTRSALEKRDFLDCMVLNPRLNGVTIEYDLKTAWRMLLDLRGN